MSELFDEFERISGLAHNDGKCVIIPLYDLSHMDLKDNWGRWYRGGRACKWQTKAPT